MGTELPLPPPPIRLKLLGSAAMAALVSIVAIICSRTHPGATAGIIGAIAGAAIFLLAQNARARPAGKTPDDIRRMLERAESIAGFGSYTLLTDSTGDAIAAWSPQLRLMLGGSEVDIPAGPAEYIDRYVHADDRARVRTVMRHILAERGTASIEYRIVSDTGQVRDVGDHIEYIRGTGNANIFHGQLHDITERKRAERERFEAADRFHSFVEQLGGMPYIGSIDAQATHIYVSPKILELLGFTPEQWCSDPGLRLRQMHDDDRADFLRSVAATISSGVPLSIDYRLRRADGTTRWFHDEARLASDAAGRPMFLHGVALDITERKQAQEELARSHLELKRLIGALDAVREGEQKRLAREMHDDLGQLLAAMKMDLSALARQLPPNDGTALERLDGINALVNSMLVSVRRIIADLPPKLLDDVGLFDALQLLGNNFKNRYGVSCRLRLPEQEPPLRGKTTSTLYRLVQESLNNVAKHAQATHVDIMVETGSTLRLSVIDNGNGASQADLTKGGSFGLICMRERVAALDGELSIDTEPGAGMAIHVSLPLRVPAGDAAPAVPNETAAPGA